MISISAIERWSFVNQCRLSALILIMVILASYLLFIKPQANQLNFLQEQELSLKSNFESKQQSGGGGLVFVYQNQLKALERRFARLLKQIPVNNEMSALMTDILKIGAGSGVVFEKFAPAAQVTEDWYLALPIHMTVSGSYFQILIFLKKMQDLGRLVSWHDFEIVRKNKEEEEEGEGEGKPLQMTMLLKIYRNVL